MTKQQTTPIKNGDISQKGVNNNSHAEIPECALRNSANIKHSRVSGNNNSWPAEECWQKSPPEMQVINNQHETS